ncbi:hypothetical protein [Nocardia farcinica]|uniref:hypothetical protein n=1 Tax=Nocardia farcinica TaxID=37329 RepID=UPI00313CA441
MDDSARLPADLDRHGTTSHEVYTAGFYDGPWDFSVRSLLGKVFRGGADVGEVLATIATVAPGDRDGWFASWIALGERVAGLATAAADRGHHVSAAHAHLRAANYFGTALNAIDGLDGDTARLLPTFRAHRRSWDGFVASTRWPVERLDIPYEDTTLPGWLFRPDTSDTRRPALVVNNGSDGTCRAAGARPPRPRWNAATSCSCSTAPVSSRCCSSGTCLSGPTGSGYSPRSWMFWPAAPTWTAPGWPSTG